MIWSEREVNRDLECSPFCYICIMIFFFGVVIQIKATCIDLLDIRVAKQIVNGVTGQIGQQIQVDNAITVS